MRRRWFRLTMSRRPTLKEWLYLRKCEKIVAKNIGKEFDKKIYEEIIKK